MTITKTVLTKTAERVLRDSIANHQRDISAIGMVGQRPGPGQSRAALLPGRQCASARRQQKTPVNHFVPFRLRNGHLPIPSCTNTQPIKSSCSKLGAKNSLPHKILRCSGLLFIYYYYYSFFFPGNFPSSKAQGRNNSKHCLPAFS